MGNRIPPQDEKLFPQEEARKALDKDSEGHEVTSPGQKPRGGKAEMNSTKPAYREEVGNRTGAVRWGHMGGPLCARSRQRT